MSFASVFQGQEGSQFVTEATQGAPLGTAMELPDGRRYRYTLNGAVAAVPGSLYQGVVPSADNDALAVNTAALNAKSLLITLGSTAAAVELFRDGYINVEDDAGEGKILICKNHDAVAASAQGEFFLQADLPVAFAAATTVGLIQNLFSNVIIHPAPATAAVAGVAQSPIAAAAFGWLQVAGPCSVLGDGSVVLGEQVIVSDNLDGSVEVWKLAEAAPPTEVGVIVGEVIAVEADTEHSLISLRID